MLGLYTVSVRLFSNDKVICQLFHKNFLLKKTAYKWAKEIDGAGFSTNLTAREIKERNLYAEVFITDRSGITYKIGKVPLEITPFYEEEPEEQIGIKL